MDEPKENPRSDDDFLAEESESGADDAALLPARLERYSGAHHRGLEMSDYAHQKGFVKLAATMRSCGDYLVFRDYYTEGKVRLHAAQFCKKHILCPFCAIRRGSKMVTAYLERLSSILADAPNLKAYLVTFTVKNGSDLDERFQHLSSSIQKLHKARHRLGSEEVTKAVGAVWSYEFKRGKNSGLWHPHIHAIWLCEEPPDQHKLRNEWHHNTGDSMIVDVTPFHDQQDVIGGFLEVFKYAVKFGDLPLDDNWHAYETLLGKRLIASFGAFRAVEIPESLLDEPLDGLPFVEHFFQFFRDLGYSLQPGRLHSKIK